jgi:YD repeat-containing protein
LFLPNRKEWKYDLAGNLVEEVDSVLAGRGERIRHEYDGMNRLVKTDYPWSEDTVYVYGAPGAGYGGANRVTERRDGAGTVRYRYGKLGEVTEETRGIPETPEGMALKEQTMQYRSDYLGRMESIVYPDGEEVTYEYDYGGQIRRVGSSARPGYYYIKDIGYDEYGQRNYIEYGNGVRTRYRYHPYRRLLEGLETRREEGGTVYQDIRYTFDLAGNVLGYGNDSHGYKTTQTYGYDGLYQLTEARGESRSRPYGPGG